MFKKIAMIPIVSLFFLFLFQPGNVLAENQGQFGLTKDQADALKDQVGGLKKVFGIDEGGQTAQTTQQPAQPVSQQDQKKTAADVADKALDMVNKMVADAAATIQKVAPDVWRIMIKQQYAVAVSNLVAPWVAILILWICRKIVYKNWIVDHPTVNNSKGDEEASDEQACKMWVVGILPYAAMAALAIWGISRLADSISILINPEFYAMKSMIMILLGKG